MKDTVVEFIDGKKKEFPTDHVCRPIADLGVYRFQFKNDVYDIPLCNIRGVRKRGVTNGEKLKN